MAFIVKKKGSEFENHPETSEPIRGVIVDVTDPVQRDTPYGPKEKFAIVFETELRKDDGENWHQWSFYTPTISEKSNLGRDLKKITGLKDLPDEFDLETLIGTPVRLMVEHKVDGDKTYANVTFLGAHKGENPLTPSGNYKRQRDRQAESGVQYSKAGGASAPKQERPAWQDVKVHVGQFAGFAVLDLPSVEAVDRLLGGWWPEVEGNPSAADRRLHEALLAAQAALKPKPAATPKY